MEDSYHNMSIGKRLLSKKFIAFILITLILFVLVILETITGAEFTKMLATYIPVYLGADAIQNIGVRYSERVSGSTRERSSSYTRRPRIDPQIEGNPNSDRTVSHRPVIQRERVEPEVINIPVVKTKEGKVVDPFKEAGSVSPVVKPETPLEKEEVTTSKARTRYRFD